MDISGTIRTLGLHQPYASLMLHGKIETRWVEEGRKPPFPLGKYLLYSTKKDYGTTEFMQISGQYAVKAMTVLKGERTFYTGVPIGLSELINVRLYKPESDGPLTFVDSFDGKMSIITWDKKTDDRTIKNYVLWCLEFGPVKRLQYTFDFDEGKQGVGILSEATKAKIVFEDLTRIVGKPLKPLM